VEILKVQSEDLVNIFGEYTVPKYGDLLGNKRLKTLIVAEEFCQLCNSKGKICCDF
jgi:hypothetical protein